MRARHRVVVLGQALVVLVFVWLVYTALMARPPAAVAALIPAAGAAAVLAGAYLWLRGFGLPMTMVNLGLFVLAFAYTAVVAVLYAGAYAFVLLVASLPLVAGMLGGFAPPDPSWDR
jgi:hypothetical protein